MVAVGEEVEVDLGAGVRREGERVAERDAVVAPGFKRRDVAIEVDSSADRPRQRIEVNLTPGKD